jgi:DNA segregation ATPase FtsK/SpoIIIE, S-DNA-T family
VDWFKKIFHVFKEDSSENEDTYGYKRPLPKSKSKETNSPKDLNAKISYQYPKGSFRFPLIPDIPNEPRPKRKERKGNQMPETPANKEVNSISIHQPKKPLTKRNHGDIPVKISDKETRSETKPTPKKGIRTHGPFRPTEIPSPIYGYERPKRNQNQVVEYELTGFIHDEMEQETINDCQKKAIDFVNLEVDTRINSEPAATIEAEAELEKTAALDVELGKTETSDVELENTVTPDVELEKIVIPVVEFEKIVIPDVEFEKTVIPDVEFEKTVIPDLEFEITPTPEAELEKTATPDKREEESAAQEENQKVVGIQNERTDTQNRRSHLPFNVIMLKQDRKKLEDRRVIKEISAPIEMEEEKTVDYAFPDEQLLLPKVPQEANEEWLLYQETLLNRTLSDFNVGAKVVNVTQGPSVTRFEVQPDAGVKVNKITNLQDDIKLSLAAKDIRIEAPIPGKHTIGIEVPNQSSRPVLISEILLSPQFRQSPSPLTAALGLDISGNPVVTDLRKMPHGLIAGATGSGKSVCINTILASLLYKANPNDVKLMLIDPKMVELAPYNEIPHLVSPVITDVKAATAALKWAVEEMERRYELFAHTGVRDIARFNELALEAKRYSDKLPYMLVVIDELADLMMVAPQDVEESICRIAQKARACGIHLIIATQRPSVDVITGLIKANIPTRIAFSVSSQIDSRTIIDMSGAEKLLGRGDMLFLGNGTSKPIRLQGTFISDDEIDKVVSHVRNQGKPEYLFDQSELLKKAQVNEEEDELFYEACEFVIEQGGASTSSLQRRFKIGYNRAARLIDFMEQNGFISEAKGSKPRDVLITEQDLDSINGSSTIN